MQNLKLKILAFGIIGLLCSCERQDIAYTDNPQEVKSQNQNKIADPNVQGQQQYITLMRMYSHERQQHYYAGSTGFPALPLIEFDDPFYAVEGNLGKIASTGQAFAPPIHAYLDKYRDFFMTTNTTGEDLYGFKYLGIIGYSNYGPGAVPVYRYYNGDKHDHFYTTNFSELYNGGQGYNYEGIAFYVTL